MIHRLSTKYKNEGQYPDIYCQEGNGDDTLDCGCEEEEVAAMNIIGNNRL